MESVNSRPVSAATAHPTQKDRAMKLKLTLLSVFMQTAFTVSGAAILRLDHTRASSTTHQILFWTLIPVFLLSAIGTVWPIVKHARENDKKMASLDTPIVSLPQIAPDFEFAVSGEPWSVVDTWASKYGYKLNAGSTSGCRFYKKMLAGFIPGIIAIECDHSWLRITSWTQTHPDPQSATPLFGIPRMVIKKQIQNLASELNRFRS